MSGPNEGSSRDVVAAAAAANVERYTVRPVAPAHTNPVDVVVTLPDGELLAAFARAREIARQAGSVRLVAHGATLPSAWPSWVATEPGLVLSELGAYKAGNTLDATAGLRATYRKWIEEVFAGAAPPGAAAHIYYAPVVARLFQPTFESQIFVGGVAAVHAHSKLHLVGDERLAFAALVGEEPSSIAGRARELALPPAIAAAWFAACAFTLAQCLQLRRGARRSLDEIASRSARPHRDPSLWVGLVPDWNRINKHLLDAGATPELHMRGRLGVLLLGTLRSGMRDDQRLKAVHHREDLWAGLGALRDDLDRCVVAQAVQPRTNAAYARALAASLKASATVALRMVRNSGPLRASAQNAGLGAIARRAAATATLDVARSVLAEHATRELVEEHDFRGKVVVLAGAQAAGFTSVEWVLREAGAITVEHAHGAGGGGEWFGDNESCAMVQCVWTLAETRELERVRKCIVGGMPEVMKLRPRKRGMPRRVLLLSNYVHRDRPYPALPWEPFQVELLRVPALLREALGDALEFRWRPHPADENEAVARGHAQAPFVALSRNRPLAEDLDGCDVLISGNSTALREAVLAGVPCFVHMPPDTESELPWVPLERRFFRAEELVAPFVAWADAMGRDAPEASEPDARARIALFGPSGRPRSLHDAIEPLMARDHGAPEP